MPKYPQVTMRRRLRRWLLRRFVPSDTFLLLVLVIVAVAIGSFSMWSPTWIPMSMIVMPVLAGGCYLRTLSQFVLDGVVVVMLLLELRSTAPGDIPPGAVVFVLVTIVFVLLMSRKRAELGVTLPFGESMLVDLRDRLRAQGELPPLPPGWHAEINLRPAGGDSFGGDFVVASRSTDGDTLEVVLVDVSGKGKSAGTRALQLSGALGGLLGSLPPSAFLAAANGYLLRQSWNEGFATAAHLVLDLNAGTYHVLSAGHPPAARFDNRTSSWHLLEGTGPPLGIVPDVDYQPHRGRLEAGDTLVLFTDGLVEVPGRDIQDGIDRLLGETERALRAGPAADPAGGQIVASVGRDIHDDRTLVLVSRH